MKYIILSILNLVFASSLAQSLNWFPPHCKDNNLSQVSMTQDAQCNYDPWVVIFEDQFDGIEIDQSKWIIPNQGVVRDFNFANQKYWTVNTGINNVIPSVPLNNNLEVSNGTLKILTKYEPVTGSYIWWGQPGNPVVSNSFLYTSGEINSKYKFKHGKFEIRCKIPAGLGYWPAFWLFGQFGNLRYEIDVFEFWDNNTTSHNMTVHYDGDKCLSDYTSSVGFDQEMHTYTVIWDDYKIQWLVDQAPVRTDYRFRTILNQDVGCNGVYANISYLRNDLYPKEPMSVIADVAVQNGTFAPDPNITPLVSQLEIEYISVSKQIDCSSSLTILDNNALNMGLEEYNVLMGSTITLGGNVSLLPGQQLTIIATNQIVLLPGFVALPGSQLTLIVNPNICVQLKTANLESIIMASNPMISIPNNMDDVTSFLENYHTVMETSLEENVKVPISEISELEEISISPNPASNEVFVNFTSDSKYLIILFDELGNILNSCERYNESEIKLDLRNLNKGIYLIKAINRTTDGISVFKILHN